MNDHYSGKNAHIIKATRILQAKVGSGDIDPKKIEKSQSVIETNTTDFAPMATAFLDQLERAMRNTPDEPSDPNAALQPIIVEVMQIKANASMFSYELVGALSGLMLNFLEDIKGWDFDVRQIVEAHVKTLRHIINNQMKGDGGQQGALLVSELREVCQRYFIKHNISK